MKHYNSMQWAEYIINKHGTIVYVKDLKIGDMIVLLERQNDLGNAIPVVLTNVEKIGKTQIVIEATLSTRQWYHGCHENTLVFLLDPSQAQHSLMEGFLSDQIDRLESELASVKEERDTLREACRQARACLLNLQPNEVNPIQRQMQKMVHELSIALGDID
jgi:hypothetical protein